jgi:predicted nucleic acid-binding protein
MSIVCVDTNILCWAVLEIIPSQNEHLVPLAKKFMQWLIHEKHEIILPTVIIGELLLPLPEDRHPAVLASLTNQFMIAEYNLRAAQLFAQIRRSAETVNKFRNRSTLDPQLTRRELIADAMIVATAMAHRANILYTHDKGLLNIAEGFIPTMNFTQANFPKDKQSD